MPAKEAGDRGCMLPQVPLSKISFLLAAGHAAMMLLESGGTAVDLIHAAMPEYGGVRFSCHKHVLIHHLSSCGSNCCCCRSCC